MHGHTNHDIVVKILTIIAENKNTSFNSIRRKFIKENYNVTLDFWKTLRKEYPSNAYATVWHCPGCKKFELDECNHSACLT